MTIACSSPWLRKAVALIVIFCGAVVNLHLSGTVGLTLSSLPVDFDVPILFPDNDNATEPETSRNVTMPTERLFINGTVGLVHIGKTGGSTLSTLLRNGCTSLVRKRPCYIVENETIVSKLVVRTKVQVKNSCSWNFSLSHAYKPLANFQETYYHVPDFHSLPRTTHRAYIVTARDAYNRAVSAFLYHHPKNAAASQLKLTSRQEKFGPLAYGCFETLEDFAALAKTNETECNYYPYRPTAVNVTDCSALACATLHGKVRFFAHLFFNYQKIMSMIPTDPPRILFVMRQEHYWEDWENLNILLGQEDPVVIPGSDFNKRNISDLELPVSRDISERRRLKLCVALQGEYHAYFRLLAAARNLQENDVMDAVQIAKSNCPNLDFQAMVNR